MFELSGTCGSAVVYADEIEPAAIAQICTLLEEPWAEDAHIRIMPDAHAGKGCTIGTTMLVTDKVVPNLVGVDLGCGMLAARLDETEVDFEALDRKVHEHVPLGFRKRDVPHRLADHHLWERLLCKDDIDLTVAATSIGTLGGGNHFIELDRDDEGCLWLVIHTGSRHLGLSIANHYQGMAIRDRQDDGMLKSPDLAFLIGEHLQAYLHDVAVAQDYARTNRAAILESITSACGLTVNDAFESVHNYIDEAGVLRKGATCATFGTRAVIPLNMRDGTLIVRGLGNPEWNESAPHGAGRRLSRAQAREQIPLQAFKEAMRGIYSTSVGRSTLDESPMAYKSAKNVIDNIADTATILAHMLPVYNCKAS